MTSDAATNAEEPLSRDLPCPDCEYNLRGLGGNPVRCPECGSTYSRGYLDEYEAGRAKGLSRRKPTPLEREVRRVHLIGCLPMLPVVFIPFAVFNDLLFGETGLFDPRAGTWLFYRVAAGYWVLAVLALVYVSRGRWEHLSTFLVHQFVALPALLINGVVAFAGGAVVFTLGFAHYALAFLTPVVFSVILAQQPVPVLENYRFRLLRPLAEERLKRREHLGTQAGEETPDDH